LDKKVIVFDGAITDCF